MKTALTRKSTWPCQDIDFPYIRTTENVAQEASRIGSLTLTMNQIKLEFSFYCFDSQIVFSVFGQ